MKLLALTNQITQCAQCPRLVEYRSEVAQKKRRAYRTETYWGKPVAGFGDPNASLWIVGLAPGAHGANRTGRVFTGDESGKFLYRALHRTGYANLPESKGPGDGLLLCGAFISCIVRCVPPQNKPSPQEMRSCKPYLHTEWNLLKRARVILTLGALAYQSVTELLLHSGYLLSDLNSDAATSCKVPVKLPKKGKPKFAHGLILPFLRSDRIQKEKGAEKIYLLTSYHVSQQNTFTGKLTETMFEERLKRAQALTH